MVCAMQELSTTAVAITDHQQQHHQLTQHHQQHQQHQQQHQQQQVEIVRTMPTQFLTTNAGTQHHQNHHPQQQLTTIVVLTTPAALQNNGQPTQFQQQTVINVQQQQPPQQQQQQQQHQQQQQQKLLNNKSQQLKKQHASLVRLLESAPITKKPLIQKQTQNTSPLQQQQQQIVIPQLQQQQQIIYVQQHPQQQQQQHQQLAQQLAQPKRLKTSSSSSSSLSSATLSLTTIARPLKQQHHQQQQQHLVVLPPTTTTTNISDNSNIIKTLNTSNHNISTITPINQEQHKPQQQQQDLQQPQQHQPQQQQHHHLENKEQDLRRLKHDNESGIDEDQEDPEDIKQRKLENSFSEAIYEPQQCPWKKIRYARELKQKEQMQIQQKQQEIKEDDAKSGKCDILNDKQHNNTTSNNIIINNNNTNTSSQYELNLAEQTHKEIAILLQQQHQNYQQQQLQQQQQQQHQHRRDSSDSNSSLISNTSSTHSLSNGCTCTPQQLQLQRDTSDDDIYHDQEQQHQNYSISLTSRRSSLIHEEEQQECQCADRHLDNMDDSGCDDDQKEEEQSTLNYLCQKFDENLETGKHQNQQQTTDLDKVAILIKKEEQQQQQEMEANINNNEQQQLQITKQQKDEGFFRRSIQQKIQYRPCTKNQQCSILRINRNRCQYCRLKKCIAVGMSRDAVRFGRVPKREKARILAAMQQSTQNRGQQRALSGELDDQPRLLSAVLRAHLETCEFTKEKVAAMRQRARECPSYSMPTLLACPLNPAPELQSEQEFSQRFAHVIRGVIDFAGMIPGFQLLSQDDKFTLLKAGLFDALFVRLICMFDNSINSIICLNGQVMRRDAIQNGANARFLVDSTFNFAERMNSMNLTDAEIGLFCAIVLITPDRPGLRNIELIEKMYSRLKGCLQTIINQNRPDQPEFMNKLLETMPDLRTLSTLHTEKLVVFRTEHKELLRQQMWSMEDEQPALSKSPNSWEDHRMDVEAKSPLGSVSSTESGDLEYQTATTTTSSTTSHLITHHSQQQTSSLASSAPLLAATLSGSCPLRNRANSGSSGDSTNELDIVGSHAHLTQNGLTITPIVRAHSHQQLHHHLTAGTAQQHRYRKLDSPTDSGIESGNEKNECGSKIVSSGGSSSCSSPRSSVDDALDCTDNGNNATTSQVTVSVSPVRSPQPLTQQASSTSSSTPANTATLKRQIVDDMPVLKRVLQAPPLYDTNSLMDEAYKPHKKFRALRHREYDCTEGDASSSTNMPAAAASPQHHTNTNAQSPPPANSSTTTTQQQQQQVLMVPQATHSPQQAPLNTTPPAIAQHQSQLHMHLTRPTPTNSQQQQQQPTQQSSLSSTHSVLAKSLMAEPRMTPEQIKRQDIIQNYIMRDSPNNTSLLVCSPHGPGSRSPAPQHLQMHNLYNSSNSPNSSTSPNSNCNSPSTTTTTSNSTHIVNALASPPVNNHQQTAAQQRWSGHSVITTTTINQRQQSVSPSSNGSSSSSTSSTASSSSSTAGCQYFQSPHSTSASVSPPRPSPSAMNTSPRLLELQVDIADSQQPLNLSKKSPTPPPSKLQALVAAATAAQRYPTVSADVTVTATTQQAANTTTQVQKVMLEA